MKFWITPDGNYYEGIHVAEGSVGVLERPSNSHQWTNGEWVFVQETPTTVTMRQARLALFSFDLLDSVMPAINSLSSPTKEKALIEWEYAQEVSRDKDIVLLLSELLGLGPEDLNQLFITASSL